MPRRSVAGSAISSAAVHRARVASGHAASYDLPASFHILEDQMRCFEVRRYAIRLGLLVLAVLVTLGSVSSSANAQEKAKKRRIDSRLITRVDLDESTETVTTAFDAVRLLRPQWLTPPRGRIGGASGVDQFSSANPNASEPVIYIDETKQSGMDVLRTLPAKEVWELKYLDQNRALQLIGPGNEAGAIQITTMRRRP